MMPKTAKTDSHAIIYVRVDPADKARLRALADREFGGSMAACFRHLLEAHIGKTRRSVEPPKRVGFLDED